MRGDGRVIVSASIELGNFLKARELISSGQYKGMSDVVNSALTRFLEALDNAEDT
jgi:Arc/MetJ-type ribon-helix-helix transcriptional regulator